MSQVNESALVQRRSTQECRNYTVTCRCATKSRNGAKDPFVESRSTAIGLRQSLTHPPFFLPGCPTLGKSKRGLTNGGLKPQIFRENRANILPGKSGLFGPDWSLFRVYRGLSGADRDRFLPHLTAAGRRQKFSPKGLFGPNWCLLG